MFSHGHGQAGSSPLASPLVSEREMNALNESNSKVMFGHFHGRSQGNGNGCKVSAPASSHGHQGSLDGFAALGQGVGQVARRSQQGSREASMGLPSPGGVGVGVGFGKGGVTPTVDQGGRSHVNPPSYFDFEPSVIVRKEKSLSEGQQAQMGRDVGTKEEREELVRKNTG